MEKFFTKRKYTIEGISNIIQATTVIILAIITFWYAYSTKKMVDVMQNEFNITNRPYISVEDSYNSLNNNQLTLGIVLMNRGKVPAKITSFKSSVPGKIPETTKKEEMIIFPLETKKRAIVVLYNDGINKSADLFFEISYYSNYDKNNNTKYCTKYNYEYNGDPKSTLVLKSASECD